jgi:kinesin family protein 6/9
MTMTTSSTSNNSSQPEKQESNGIEVYLRIRPSSNPSGYFSQDDIDETQFVFQLPKKQTNVIKTDNNNNNNSGDDNETEIANNTRTRYGFKFNGILDGESNQENVFRTIGAPAVRNVLDGFNSTVFAYGQTGSGEDIVLK